MQSGWSATQYSKFIEDRTRAARDLLSAVPLEAPGHVVDLGCGPGNSTALLCTRYPDAKVMGLDSDPDMIATAQKNLPNCRFTQANIEDWRPDVPPDLLFANASLQWVGDHHALFPHLMGLIAPQGALAVQMPDNLAEPSHLAMAQIAADPRWADRLAKAAARRKPLIAPQDLYALLRPMAAKVDVWRTIYHFELQGIEGIVEWFKGSALRPLLGPLNAAEQADFLDQYRALLAQSYPLVQGRVLLAFPRYFFVAIK